MLKALQAHAGHSWGAGRKLEELKAKSPLKQALVSALPAQRVELCGMPAVQPVASAKALSNTSRSLGYAMLCHVPSDAK